MVTRTVDPLGSAGTIQSNGLVWKIEGTPLVRRTRIRLLKEGRYSEQITVGFRMRAARMLLNEMKPNIPVDTGSLQNSAHTTGDSMILGPRKYNRARLKAIRAGRVYKKRGRGRPRLTGFYGLLANERSRNTGYIEAAIHAVSEELVQILEGTQGVERDERDLQTALAGQRIARGAQPFEQADFRLRNRLANIRSSSGFPGRRR